MSCTYTYKNKVYTDLEQLRLDIGQEEIRINSPELLPYFIPAYNLLRNSGEVIPHEYAHHYIAWFRDTPIVQEGIKRFGSEEALVQAIGEQVVNQKGEAYNWWKKFTSWILSLLSDKQVLQILTDSFINRQSLNDFVGTNPTFSIEDAKRNAIDATNGVFNQTLKVDYGLKPSQKEEILRAFYMSLPEDTTITHTSEVPTELNIIEYLKSMQSVQGDDYIKTYQELTRKLLPHTKFFLVDNLRRDGVDYMVSHYYQGDIYIDKRLSKNELELLLHEIINKGIVEKLAQEKLINSEIYKDFTEFMVSYYKAVEKKGKRVSGINSSIVDFANILKFGDSDRILFMQESNLRGVTDEFEFLFDVFNVHENFSKHFSHTSHRDYIKLVRRIANAPTVDREYLLQLARDRYEIDGPKSGNFAILVNNKYSIIDEYQRRIQSNLDTSLESNLLTLTENEAAQRANLIYKVLGYRQRAVNFESKWFTELSKRIKTFNKKIYEIAEKKYNEEMKKENVLGNFGVQGSKIVLSQETETGVLREPVLMHEILHSTQYLFRVDESVLTKDELKLREGIEELYKSVKQHNPDSKHYGLTNVLEFLSEGLTSPSFAFYLNSIRSNGERIDNLPLIGMMIPIDEKESYEIMDYDEVKNTLILAQILNGEFNSKKVYQLSIEQVLRSDDIQKQLSTKRIEVDENTPLSKLFRLFSEYLNISIKKESVLENVINASLTLIENQATEEFIKNRYGTQEGKTFSLGHRIEMVNIFKDFSDELIKTFAPNSPAFKIMVEALEKSNLIQNDCK